MTRYPHPDSALHDFAKLSVIFSELHRFRISNYAPAFIRQAAQLIAELHSKGYSLPILFKYLFRAVSTQLPFYNNKDAYNSDAIVHRILNRAKLFDQSLPIPDKPQNTSLSALRLHPPLPTDINPSILRLPLHEAISSPFVQPPEQPSCPLPDSLPDDFKHDSTPDYPLGNSSPLTTGLNQTHLSDFPNQSLNRYTFIPPPPQTPPPLRNAHAITLDGDEFVPETTREVEILLQHFSVFNSESSEPYILQYSDDVLSCISFLTPDSSLRATYHLTLCGLRTEDTASATTLIANLLHTERSQFRYTITVSLLDSELWIIPILDALDFRKIEDGLDASRNIFVFTPVLN